MVPNMTLNARMADMWRKVELQIHQSDLIISSLIKANPVERDKPCRFASS